MAGAVGAIRVDSKGAALTAGGRSVLATLGSEVWAGRFVCHFDPRLRDGDTPPRVFWKKRLQGIENKGQEREKERQESWRGGKRLDGKEIEGALKKLRRAVWLKRALMKRGVWRVFTSHDTKDYRKRQSFNVVLVFKDWAQQAEAALRTKVQPQSGGAWGFAGRQKLSDLTFVIVATGACSRVNQVGARWSDLSGPFARGRFPSPAAVFLAKSPLEEHEDHEITGKNADGQKNDAGHLPPPRRLQVRLLSVRD
jgi:hypothetical protein